MSSGAYLGGGPLCHGPPLWVARIAKLHRKVSKIEAWPPLCKLGIRFDHAKAMFGAFPVGFAPLVGFIFALHLILGENSDYIWVKTFFFLLFTWFWAKIRTRSGRNNFCFRSLFLPNFLKFLAPPPFQNPAYATAWAYSLQSGKFSFSRSCVTRNSTNQLTKLVHFWKSRLGFTDLMKVISSRACFLTKSLER